ncbi:hypothetical protein LCGC14_0583260 [marine sediment metagenome]|uniref:Minor tail T domain-containing protein n=1 Tax=marine sediment metagenome TaxID=412755 RepID=A0A0F9U1Z0_9ZZZZ
MIFHSIEPIGGERQDYNAAMIAAHSGMSKGKVDPRPFGIKTMPSQDEVVAKGQAVQAMFQSMAKRHR